MSMRRFRTPREGWEGVEFDDGRCVIEHPTMGPMRYSSFVTCEQQHGRLDWIDPPRPDWSPTAIASVVLPDILGDGEEFLRLLSWLTGMRVGLWTAALATGLCRLARPHLEAQFPWLRQVQQDWRIHEDPAAEARHRDDVAGQLMREHTGPWRVEPMTPRQVFHRMMVMKVQTSRPYPQVLPIGPMHLV